SDCSWVFLPSCRGGVLLRQPPGLAQRFAQRVFDLRVEAAQFVVGPALRGGEHVGVDAQRVGLLRAHGPPRPLRRAAKTGSSTATTIALTRTTIATTTRPKRSRSSPAHHSPAAESRPIMPTASIRRASLRSSLALPGVRGASFGSRQSVRAMKNAGRLDSANTMAARLASPTAAASVQRAGVDDGLGGAVAAQHHQQVADHVGLALLVEFD